MVRNLTGFLLLALVFSGCSLHSGSTYERSEMGSPEYFKKGVILSVREVEIKGTESGAGAAAGALWAVLLWVAWWAMPPKI